VFARDLILGSRAQKECSEEAVADDGREKYLEDQERAKKLRHCELLFSRDWGPTEDANWAVTVPPECGGTVHKEGFA